MKAPATIVATFLAFLAAAKAQQFTAIELPALTNLGVTWDFQRQPIQAINDRGEILAATADWETEGYASYMLDGAQWHPIVYHDAFGVHPTSSVDFNNRGDVLFSWPFGNSILSRGNFVSLPADPVLFPSRINDGKEVVGFFNGPGLVAGAFLFSRGLFFDLGPAAPDFAPLINNRGQVAFAAPFGPRLTAVVVSKAKTNEIGTLGGWNAAPLGLNNRGDVVGVSQTGDLIHHAFAYIDGEMTDLTPNEQYGEATAINDHKFVIGWWYKNGVADGFVFRDGRRHDLRSVVENGDEWNFIVPTSSSTARLNAVLNNHGQIAGYARHNGKAVGFLLTPKSKR